MKAAPPPKLQARIANSLSEGPALEHSYRDSEHLAQIHFWSICSKEVQGKGRLRNREKFLWLTGGRFPDFFDLSLVFVENGGFGASPARTSVASIPAVFFFFMSLLKKHMLV